MTGRVRPRDAVLLGTSAAGLSEWLAPVLPNLVAGPRPAPGVGACSGYAGCRSRSWPTCWPRWTGNPPGGMACTPRSPTCPREERAELGALPVPLADGRLVRGPRGLLLPGPGLEHADRLAVLGLRVVHPEAAHPLLARLGAVEATPRSVLEDPATRAAVKNSYDSAVEAAYDDDSPQRLADAVLGLLAALDVAPGEYPWLAELALPGEDGDWYPAGELLLPGAPLAAVIAEDAPFGTVDPDLVERHGADALRAAGVLWSFGLLAAEDVELDESRIDLDLDGADEWAADTSDRLRHGRGWPAAAAASRRRVHRRPGPRPRRPGSLAAGPGPADPAAAARRADRADPGPPARRPARRRPVLHGLVAAPPRDARRAAPVGPARCGRRPAAGRPVRPGRRPGEADADPALTRVLADPAIARALGVRSSLTALLAEPGGADELLAGSPTRRARSPGRNCERCGRRSRPPTA